jgi:hypothetical protein
MYLIGQIRLASLSSGITESRQHNRKCSEPLLSVDQMRCSPAAVERRGQRADRRGIVCAGRGRVGGVRLRGSPGKAALR